MCKSIKPFQWAHYLFPRQKFPWKCLEISWTKLWTFHRKKVSNFLYNPRDLEIFLKHSKPTQWILWLTTRSDLSFCRKDLRWNFRSHKNPSKDTWVGHSLEKHPQLGVVYSFPEYLSLSSFSVNLCWNFHQIICNSASY